METASLTSRQDVLRRAPSKEASKKAKTAVDRLALPETESSAVRTPAAPKTEARGVLESARRVELHLRRDRGTDLEVEIPLEAFELLVGILNEMADGRAVTLVPNHAELTTQQAADLLNVSRPFITKLIDDGRLACRRVGSHRRIRAEELMAFKARDDAERRRVAEALSRDAQDLELDY